VVGKRHAPPNTPGIRHVTFAVEDIDAVVARLRARGAELVGELERYEDSYRLCYVRGGNHLRASGEDRLTDRVVMAVLVLDAGVRLVVECDRWPFSRPAGSVHRRDRFACCGLFRFQSASTSDGRQLLSKNLSSGL
jgi:catechol 2,3-dioxygenase-like lactoylglutathione lyase family enzyme